MDIQSATQLIGSLGFPIFCTLALGYFVYKSYDNLSKSNKEREIALYEMLGKAQVTIENALETNAKLAATVDKMMGDTAEIKQDVEEIKETIAKLPKRKGDISE